MNSLQDTLVCLSVGPSDDVDKQRPHLRPACGPGSKAAGVGGKPLASLSGLETTQQKGPLDWDKASSLEGTVHSDLSRGLGLGCTW
jgi:hypothetical protein